MKYTRYQEYLLNRYGQGVYTQRGSLSQQLALTQTGGDIIAQESGSTSKPPLMWTEALRSLGCMLPMLVASGLGKTTYLVALGQGGFFFSSLFLPKKTGGRFVMGSLVLALGLGFYLIGGTVAPNPWTGIIFTFLVCLNLSFLTNWNIGDRWH